MAAFRLGIVARRIAGRWISGQWIERSLAPWRRGLLPRSPNLPGVLRRFVRVHPGPFRFARPEPGDDPATWASFAERIAGILATEGLAFAAPWVPTEAPELRLRRADVLYALRARNGEREVLLVGATRRGRVPSPRQLQLAQRALVRDEQRDRRRSRSTLLRSRPEYGRPPRMGFGAVEESRELVELRRRSEILEWNAARVAHDLRIPIATMRATLDAESRRKAGGDFCNVDGHATHTPLDRLRQQLRTLEDLCEDVLAVRAGSSEALHGREPSGWTFQGRPNAPDADVRIAQIIAEFADAFAARGVGVVQKGRAPGLLLPRAAERIVRNVLANAGRFAHKQIRVATSCAPGLLQIEIADDGPGLPETTVARSLAGHNLGRGGSGWGMGLASAQLIAEDLGGALRTLPARAGESGGARFLLVLPATPIHTDDQHDGPDRTQEHDREPLGQLRSLRVR